MPDVKSVLASYEKTISANDKAGVTSRMFLNNIAKQKQPLKMTLQSSRGAVANRRRPQPTDPHSSTNRTAPHQLPRSSLNKRLNEATRSSKGSTDVTITTCPLEDDLDEADAAAWAVTNGDPFGEDESCHIDDNGFGPVSRHNEDSLNGSFASFTGSFASINRHDPTGISSSSGHHRNTSRSTRTRHLSNDEDDGFTVIFHGQDDDASAFSHSCVERDTRNAKTVHSKSNSTRPASTSEKRHIRNEGEAAKKTNDTGKRSNCINTKDSTVASSQSSSPCRSGPSLVAVVRPHGEPFTSSTTRRVPSRSKNQEGLGEKQRPSTARSLRPSSLNAESEFSPGIGRSTATAASPGGPREQNFSSSTTSRLPSRSKNQEGLGEKQRHWTARPVRPSSLNAESELSPCTGHSNATAASPGVSRHSRASVKDSDDSSCSPRQPRGTSTRGSTNFRRSSIAGRACREQLNSDSRPARVTSSRPKSTSSFGSSSRTCPAANAPHHDQGRSAQDKRDDTFRKMLDHSQNFDWDG